jgi:hypothetical protein
LFVGFISFMLLLYSVSAFRMLSLIRLNPRRQWIGALVASRALA